MENGSHDGWAESGSREWTDTWDLVETMAASPRVQYSDGVEYQREGAGCKHGKTVSIREEAGGRRGEKTENRKQDDETEATDDHAEPWLQALLVLSTECKAKPSGANEAASSRAESRATNEVNPSRISDVQVAPSGSNDSDFQVGASGANEVESIHTDDVKVGQHDDTSCSDATHDSYDSGTVDKVSGAKKRRQRAKRREKEGAVAKGGSLNERARRRKLGRDLRHALGDGP